MVRRQNAVKKFKYYFVKFIFRKVLAITEIELRLASPFLETKQINKKID